MAIEMSENGKAIDVLKSQIKKIQVSKSAGLIMEKQNLVFQFNEKKNKLYVVTVKEAEKENFGQPVSVPMWEVNP